MVKKEKISSFLMEKRITPMQFIIFVIGLMYYIYQETEIFNEMNTIIKISVYITLYAGAMLFGMSFLKVKEIASKLKEIGLDPKLTDGQKINAYLNLTSGILGAMNQIFDMWGGIIPLTEKAEKQLIPKEVPEPEAPIE